MNQNITFRTNQNKPLLSDISETNEKGAVAVIVFGTGKKLTQLPMACHHSSAVL